MNKLGLKTLHLGNLHDITHIELHLEVFHVPLIGGRQYKFTIFKDVSATFQYISGNNF